jgi:hypothetical protein
MDGSGRKEIAKFETFPYVMSESTTTFPSEKLLKSMGGFFRSNATT